MKSDGCCDKGHFDSVLLVLLLPEIKSEKRESSLFFFFFMLKLNPLSATNLEVEKLVKRYYMSSALN